MLMRTTPKRHNDAVRLRGGHLNYGATIDLVKELPCAIQGEYELTDEETRKLRQQIYKINSEGEMRFKTMREAPYTIVWRVL